MEKMGNYRYGDKTVKLTKIATYQHKTDHLTFKNAVKWERWELSRLITEIETGRITLKTQYNER